LGDPLPLTVAEVDAVGATLKAGGYVSHKGDLSRLTSEAERRGAIVDPIAVHRARKDAERSCARGLGGREKGKGSLWSGSTLYRLDRPLGLKTAQCGPGTPWCYALGGSSGK